MVAVVQRVSRAEVRIAGREPARIGRGLLILLGVARGDVDADAEWLARKCLSLRIFSDAEGRMNLGLEDVGASLLVVSQFTLLGDCVKGRRPSWSDAADPGEAERLYERFTAELRRSPFPVVTGVFQATMQVESVNEGPVTLWIDTRRWKGRPAGTSAGESTAAAAPAPFVPEAAQLLMGREEPLVLASASPRRAQLLAMLGLRFAVVAPDGEDGRREPGEPSAAYVERQARVKALGVARRAARGLVLGADTIVELDGEVLEKPRDAGQAVEFLRRLSGREHEVYTGICLARAGGAEARCAVERSLVRFVDLDEDAIRRYVATGEPLDKAGAYGIQGVGGMFVASIRGCYFNVMGLPLARLRSLFHEMGREAGESTGGEADGEAS